MGRFPVGSDLRVRLPEWDCHLPLRQLYPDLSSAFAVPPAWPDVYGEADWKSGEGLEAVQDLRKSIRESGRMSGPFRDLMSSDVAAASHAAGVSCSTVRGPCAAQHSNSRVAVAANSTAAAISAAAAEAVATPAAVPRIAAVRAAAAQGAAAGGMGLPPPPAEDGPQPRHHTITVSELSELSAAVPFRTNGSCGNSSSSSGGVNLSNAAARPNKVRAPEVASASAAASPLSAQPGKASSQAPVAASEGGSAAAVASSFLPEGYCAGSGSAVPLAEQEADQQQPPPAPKPSSVLERLLHSSDQSFLLPPPPPEPSRETFLEMYPQPEEAQAAVA